MTAARSPSWCAALPPLGLVAAGLLAACAAPRVAAPVQLAAAVATRAPQPAGVPRGAAGPAPVEETTVARADVSGFAGAVQARDAARVRAALACADAHRCARPAPIAVDDEALAAALVTRARAPAERAVQSSLARAVIEDALAAGAAERDARRRAFTFVEGGSVFLLDDAEALASSARRGDRRRWLAAARPALAAAAGVDAEERAVVVDAAKRAGVSRGELLARRVGLDERALRKLVDAALAATAPLLGPVASDVTLLPDVVADRDGGRARAARALRVVRAASAQSADPVFLASAAAATGLATDAARRALVVEVRRDALGVIAVLDGAGPDARDALASRILDPAADIVPGAGVFLHADEGGVVVDRFIASLRAPALAQRTLSGADLAASARAWSAAPPVDEQGFPEAFVEVLKVLPELAR